MVDAGRVRQMVDTLPSHGIGAATTGGMLRVTPNLVDEQIELTVSDILRGTTPTDLDRRLASTAAQELHIPNTGLGHTIARAIVEAHDGGVTLTSEVGVGSTTVVRLPHVPA